MSDPAKPPPAEPQARERLPAKISGGQAGKAVSLSPEEHERLLALAKQAEHYKDQYLRAVAEFDNTKKRLDREREEFIRFASERLVSKLLPILDSFDQALKAIDEQQDKPVPPAPTTVNQRSGQAGATGGPGQPAVVGVKLIHRQLMDLLEKEGLKRIDALGKPFDHTHHEAMQRVETNGIPEGTVVEQIQVGYALHGQVIRPALVKVAKRPEKKEE